MLTHHHTYKMVWTVEAVDVSPTIDRCLTFIIACALVLIRKVNGVEGKVMSGVVSTVFKGPRQIIQDHQLSLTFM